MIVFSNRLYSHENIFKIYFGFLERSLVFYPQCDEYKVCNKNPLSIL